jgi:DegV family protein with EDD domain
MLHILTDSTADLGHELSQRFQIQVIPLYVLLQEKSFIDGVDIGTQDLFRWVQQTGVLPKTSAPAVGDFLRFFEQDGDYLYIGISNKLSTTIRNAELAAEMLKKTGVQLVDSLNLSSGIGLLAIRAAEMRDAGFSTQEITHQIKLLVPKVRTSIVLETLDYLYKGGRCTAIQNLVGSLLHLRLVLEVREDGTLGVKDRVRGSRQKALNLLVKDFQIHQAEADLKRVFITHTGCDEDAQYLKSELLKIASIQEICITSAGSVIASHCGPGTIGVLYLLN